MKRLLLAALALVLGSVTLHAAPRLGPVAPGTAGSGLNATIVTGDAVDDQVLQGTGANAATWNTVANCVAGSQLLYTQATNTWSCEASGVNATVVTGNAADDEILVGTGANAAGWFAIGTCVEGGRMLYDPATHIVGCSVTMDVPFTFLDVAEARDILKLEYLGYTDKGQVTIGETGATFGARVEINLDSDAGAGQPIFDLIGDAGEAWIQVDTAAEVLSLGNTSTNPTISWLGTGDIEFGCGAGPACSRNMTIEANAAGAFVIEKEVTGLDFINIQTSGTNHIHFGNTTNDPDYLFLGNGAGTLTSNVNVNADLGLDVSGGNFTALGGTVDLDPTEAYTLNMDATKPATVTISDNLASAWEVQEGTNSYIDINTADGSEVVAFGNATTDPQFNFLGSGKVTVTSQTECIMLEASDLNCGGCAAATVAGTNFDFDVADFDTAADESGAWTFMVPDNLTGTTFVANVIWSTATCTFDSADDACFTVSSIGVADDEAWNTVALGTAVGADDTCVTADDLYVSPAITVTHGWVVGERAVVNLARDVDAGIAGCTADNVGVDARVHAIKVCFEVDNFFSGE